MAIRFKSATGDWETSSPTLAARIAEMRDRGHPWHTHKITGMQGVCDALNLRNAIQGRGIMRAHGYADGRIDESYDRFEEWPSGQRKGMRRRE
jgi:hypothetical protein